MHIVKKPKAVILIFLVFIFGLLWSFSQTIFDYFNLPTGCFFPGVHNHYEDYYYYLHLLKQGAAGNILATSWLQPEILPRTLVNPFFLFWGRMAAIFGINPSQTYTLLRILGYGFIFFAVYKFIGFYFSVTRHKITALLLVIFSGAFVLPTFPNLQLPSLVIYWTELDPLVRLSFVPHHLWSKIFMVLLFSYLIKKSVHRSDIIIPVILVILAGFTNPIVLATIIPALAIWVLLEMPGLLQNPKTRLKPVMSALTIIAAGTIVGIYHYLVSRGNPPWNSYADWEKNIYPISPISYIAALGPAIVVGLPGLWRLKSTSAGRLLIAWIITPFAMIFLAARFIPLGNSRYLSGYQFIPWSIAAVYGLSVIRNKSKVLFWGAVSTVIFFSGLNFFASFNSHAGYWRNDSKRWEICLPKNLISGIYWLDNRIEPGGRPVIARYPMSMVIAGLTGARVPAAHRVISLDFASRKEELDLFYSGTDREWGRQYLISLNPVFVFSEVWGDRPEYMHSLGLTLVFENDTVRIYSYLRQQTP